MNILNYLDDTINAYYQSKKDYPKSLFMSQDTKDKVFAELNLIIDLTDSWYERKDNYKGIPIHIKPDIFIEIGE